MRFYRDMLKVLAAAFIVILAIGLLVESTMVSEGIRSGLSVCGNILIPSLFPFLVLSGFLSLTDYGAVIARPLHLIWRHVYHVPDEAGAVLIMSLIGGYPVGARGIAALLKRRIIDESTASRMLSFCVNSGPSFVITAVGVGMLNDRMAGVILFITQTAATLLIGAIASLRASVPPVREAQISGEPSGIAFLSAVTGASGAMMTICAIAVIFSGMLSVVNASELPLWVARHIGLQPEVVVALIGGLFEVTGGCMAASGIGGETAFLMLSAFISFGGMSVILQIVSCLKDNVISLYPLFISRASHILLSAVMALPLWRRFCGAASAFESLSRPIASHSDSVWLSSACLIGMCTILLFSLLEKTPLNKPIFWDRIGWRQKKAQKK